MNKELWIGGMTLIEITVVVSVLAILSVFSVPAIVGIMPRFLLNAQVSALHNDFQRARITAINLNTQYRMSIALDEYPDPDSYKGEFYDIATSKWVEDANLISRDIRDGVDIAYIDSSKNTKGTFDIYFNPDGTASSREVYLENTSEQQKKIEISGSTGLIHIYNTW